MESKKPVVWMIVFGIVRHILFGIGVWLKARGLIDEETHQRMIGELVTDIVAWLFIMFPLLWSAAQKWQVFGWLRTKASAILRVQTATQLLSSVRENPSPQSIIQAAPGPDMPI